MEKISILHAIIMGIVQGLTEFLPISSSGHLVLAKYLLKADLGANSAFFEILLHLGTFIAICIVYAKDVWSLIKEFIKLVGDVYHYFKDKKPIEVYPERKMLLLVLIASVPTAILGLIIEKTLADVFMSSVLAVGLALLITAAILIFSTRIPVGHKQLKGSKYTDALFIGFVQGIAVTPGISRSGSTILGAMLLGLSRTAAAEFSFFMAIPTMLGASGLKIVKYFLDGNAMLTGQEWAIMIVGCVTAFVVSILAIKALMRYVRNHTFSAFGVYRIILGVLVLGYFAVKTLIL